MANLRRNSYSITSSNNIQIPETPTARGRIASLSSKLIQFMKKPHAFPILLSLFIILTWLSLRIHQHSHHHQSQPLSPHDDDDDDRNANLVRFTSTQISKDKRGWILNPISLALDSNLLGGAISCVSLHLGQIKPGSFRGNHRHYTCNETFVIWGATTLFRSENNNNLTEHHGYAQVVIGADEVAVAASPSGIAHALVNIDPVRVTYFIGCQDAIIDYNISSSDFNVWDDLHNTL